MGFKDNGGGAVVLKSTPFFKEQATTRLSICLTGKRAAHAVTGGLDRTPRHAAALNSQILAAISRIEPGAVYPKFFHAIGNGEMNPA
jgi:hypothetical protein